MFVTAPKKGYGRPMLSAREVGIVARRELLRNLRSTKGIAMFSLFLLGGLVFSLLVSTVISVVLKRAAQKAGMDAIPDDIQRQLFEMYLSEAYDEPTAKHLGGAPAVLYFLFKGTLVFLPFLVLLVGFDQLAGEIQHRTIRYTVGRARRASIVVGKALGVWGVISVMVLVLHLTVWVFLLVRGGGSFGAILSWGPRFWLYSSVCAAAYVGFSAIVSALFRTPIVALFVGAGAGAVLWLMHFILSHIERTRPAAWAFPNAYENLLVLPGPAQVLGGSALFLAWGALCVAGATLILIKRDV
jgi:ABC-type transport system involved in multi-copper enzyme maturation permease subunit